jgi:hypothetical protein
MESPNCLGGGIIHFISIQFNSILYFNALTQQLQEPITESAAAAAEEKDSGKRSS